MKTITIIIAIILTATACGIDQGATDGSIGGGPVVLDDAPTDAPDDAPADAPPDAAPPDAAACPTLNYGVVPCSSLAPECSEPPVPPSVEGGLHCLAGYEDDPRVPCFCVGHSSEDSWCMREVMP